MFEKIIISLILFAFALLAGFLLHLFLKKYKIRVTNQTILVAVVSGSIVSFVANFYGEGVFIFLGTTIIILASSLYLFRIYLLMPKEAEDAKFEKLMVKATSGAINDDEADSLLKKAVHYEHRGKIDDAKMIYELLVKSNTSCSSDAQICLKKFE